MNTRHVTALVTGLVLTLVPGLLSASSLPYRVQQPLLERARAAIGPGAIAQLEGRGNANATGVDGTVRVALAANGCFRVDFDSPLPDSAGFDGTTAWTRDRMGLVRKIALEESDRWKVFAWVLSGHWSDARELAVRALESQGGVPPRLELAVSGTPMAMTLTLDATTLLPAELAYVDGSGPISWTFSDYQEIAGRRLARRWSFDNGSSVDSYTIASWQSVPADAGVFRAQLGAPGDVHFDPDGEPFVDVVRVASGHLLVEPFVEGESVGAFIFDTGAGSMTIDPALADALKMEELGQVVAVGVGGKTTSSFRRGKYFELGPLTLENPVYVELDLAFLEPIFGRKVAGIVGYDVLARCVAEVETKTPYIALHDPRRYQLSGASWQELALDENTPTVHARFEGEREGLFRLDTGASGTVSFHAPAVQEFALLEGRTVTAGSQGGVGGNSAAKDGRIEWFELAGHRFEQPRVQFSLAEHGAFTDRYTIGNIGQDFLAPFRIVLDYPGDRIAFVPLAK